MSKHFLLALVLVGLANSMGETAVEDAGSVIGRVYTESGEPAVGASVYLQSSKEPGPGRPSVAKTDQEGRYSIEGVRPGTYSVHAFNAEAGYPDLFFAFNLSANQKLKEVTIAAGQRLDHIDVRLGPKPGLLSFHIVDDRTGALLGSVDYVLCQAQHPEWCLNGGAPGQTEFSVPAATEITIQVTSKGYQKVKYAEKGKASITLNPGERRQISLSLKQAGGADINR